MSKALKDEVIRTLSAKAQGMFMWVRLMVDELSKKRRDSAIKAALVQAPTGLHQMIKHVLEGYSATLDEDTASDLNDVLTWVLFAARPPRLSEISEMLRLKTGDDLLGLEDMLRDQFSGIFTLSREDNLTTADLQAPRWSMSQISDPPGDGTDTHGSESPESASKYRSNPDTTTVSFAHASISDFLLDSGQGKITADGDDHFPVGVDLLTSKINLVRTCLGVLTDNELIQKSKHPHIIIRNGDVVEGFLQFYVSKFWKVRVIRRCHYSIFVRLHMKGPA